jgi:regulator of protease activity HflC (stomatin/prohibitin superfamily)
MFGIRFVKTDPTTYLMQVRSGQIVREGVGQSFFYYGPTCSLVAVPVGSQVLPFMFEQISADFQSVTVQGNLSYRIADPKKIAGMLNFTLAANGRGYASEDPENLRTRVEGAVEVLVQQAISRRSLRDCLQGAEAVAGAVLTALETRGDVVALGLEILSCSIVAIRPKAETARALEAEVRENILKAADDAIYARRNAAVENERAIKESELDTEVAVELKQRTIRETRMEAEASIRRKEAEQQAADLEARITLEGRRQEFVGLEAGNTRTVAEAEAFRVAAVMKAIESVDPRIVQALASSGMGPAQLIALAFGNIAENAQRIGQLNMSPELLQSLMGAGNARQ